MHTFQEQLKSLQGLSILPGHPHSDSGGQVTGTGATPHLRQVQLGVEDWLFRHNVENQILFQTSLFLLSVVILTVSVRWRSCKVVCCASFVVNWISCPPLPPTRFHRQSIRALAVVGGQDDVVEAWKSEVGSKR